MIGAGAQIAITASRLGRDLNREEALCGMVIFGIIFLLSGFFAWLIMKVTK